MKWSLNLGRLFGIRVLVHWTFLILLLWVVFHEIQKGSDWPTTLLTLAYILTIFLCVVLHELGHALTAKRYGIETKKITLLPIGGVASLERLPEDPRKELQVAIAGPLVNVIICIILYPLLKIPALTSNVDLLSKITPQNFIYSIFVINLFLVLFNAIPAFPMDGGRVLRAILAMSMGRLKATNLASKLGQIIAFCFFALGFFYNPFLIFIGLFVFFGAYSENAVVQQMEFLRGHKVGEAMMTHFSILHPEDTIAEAKEKLLSGSEVAFAIMENEDIKGMVFRKDIIEALRQGKQNDQVTTIMKTDIESFKPQQKLTNVYHKIQGKGNNVFPVVENNKLQGMIDREHLNEFIMIQSALHY